MISSKDENIDNVKFFNRNKKRRKRNNNEPSRLTPAFDVQQKNHIKNNISNKHDKFNLISLETYKTRLKPRHPRLTNHNTNTLQTTSLSTPGSTSSIQQLNLVVSVFLIVLSIVGVVFSLSVIVAWIHRKIFHKKYEKSCIVKHSIIPVGCCLIYASCACLVLSYWESESERGNSWKTTIWLLTMGFNLVFGKIVYRHETKFY